MLAGDDKNSVLSQAGGQGRRPIAYTAYGYDKGEEGSLGYNGELRDSLTGHYFLGKGYRMFDTRLLRFQCPDGDRWSPFGEGGLNAYAYVNGNPVKNKDPSGHGVLKLLPIALMISQTDAAKTASRLTAMSINNADDYLDGWIVHSASAASAQRVTENNLPVASSSRGARASDSQSVVSPKKGPNKKVSFNETAERVTYEKGLKAKHWTTMDELFNAIEETERGIDPVPKMSLQEYTQGQNALAARAGRTLDTVAQARADIRKPAKEPPVLTRAGRRRYM